MAFPVAAIISTEKISVLRTKYNELIDTFENFSFEDGDLFYTGALNQTEERIVVNQGETQSGSLSKYPGIEIDRGILTNVQLVWDESDDLWKVGTISALTALSLDGHLHDSDYYRVDEDIILNDNKIINSVGENGLYLDNGNVTIEGTVYAKDVNLVNSTTPTTLVLYNTYTSVSEYERGFVKFESDVLKIGVEQTGSSLPEMGFVQTGLMKFYSYQATVNDDASFTLPVITNSAWGFITVGSNVEHSMFTIAGDGTVSLISNSTNVVNNADTDANVCIGTSVASPVVIKNRLGSNYNVNLMLFYS